MWQRAEDGLTSVPIVGDAIKSAQARAGQQFQQAALNRTVAPIGGTVDQTGQAGVQQAKDQLSTAYNNLLPKLTFAPDPQFNADMFNLKLLATALPADQAVRFNNIIDTQINGKLINGQMDGQTAKGMLEELTDQAKGYQGDSSFDNRQLGNALGSTITAVRSNLTRVNPQFADELNAVNQGYASYVPVRRAAAAGNNAGSFTPAQLQTAVRGGDQSAGKGSYATGNAPIQDLSDAAYNVLGSKVPDSGTPFRSMLAVAPGLIGAGAGTGHLPAALGTTLGALTAMAPYSALGQRLMTGILAQRPSGTAGMAAALQQNLPRLLAGPAAGGILGAAPSP